jgi:hypothetical protein
MKKPQKLSPSALLSSLRKEFAQPRVVESARVGHVERLCQMTTRLAFEAKPQWRATIKRRNNMAFILEGEGIYEGRFYEYPDGLIPRNEFSQIEMEGATLRGQLDAGQIELLKGTLLL